ncbi:MAG TPA: nucleotidyltransferase domain-containing protein [Actinomycetota bacterium]|nr:nucleotidyltransferase domain-containing protein [Actinomycetota bacterium]
MPREIEQLPVADIVRIGLRHGARAMWVFGSRARGDASPESDLDLLVAVSPRTSILDLIRMELELEELLGIDVQVVSEGSLRPPFRESVMREATALNVS